MSYVAAGAAVVSAGVGIYKSVKAKKQEKRDRAALEKAKAEQPDYEIQPEFEQNKNLYAGIAANGMPESTKDFFQSVAEQGLTSSIGAMQQFGGGINSLGDLLDKHSQSMERAAMADAQMKVAGIKDFIGANSALAGQRMIQQFGVPNERNRNDIAGINRSIYGDQASFDAGISDVTGSLAAFIGSDAPAALGEKWSKPKPQAGKLVTKPG